MNIEFSIATFFALVCVSISGCTGSSKDVPTMMLEIGQLAPVGTETDIVLKRMAENNFTCKRYMDSSVSIKNIVLQHRDFIECRREDGMGPVVTDWMIVFMLTSNKVSEINVDKGLTGP